MDLCVGDCQASPQDTKSILKRKVVDREGKESEEAERGGGREGKKLREREKG